MPPRRTSSHAVSEGSPVPTTYPERGMAPAQWESCAEMLEGVYQRRDGSRKLADIFRVLPDRDEYPDYYEAIPEPEALDHVAAGLGAGIYETAEAFFKQLHLVFLNACHYNEDGSGIWVDAKRLEIQEAWRFAAAQGKFGTSDPYSRPPPRRGRPPKKVDQNTHSPNPRTSATPVPLSIPSVPVSQSQPAMPRHPSRSRSTSAQPPLAAELPTASEAVTNQSDSAMVTALDARLPRWQGPQAVLSGGVNTGGVEGSGWWGEGAPDYERGAGGERMWALRIKAVAAAINGYRDTTGARLAAAFDLIPPMNNIPYLSFQSPLSFGAICQNVNGNRYRYLRDFDMDMVRLFEKARRFHQDGSKEYGSILVLQRLYNALTAPYPLTLPPSGIPDPSPIRFASLPAGPGNARSLHETTQELRAGVAEQDVGFGLTTFRVGTRDRMFTQEARHKGMAFRIGDYVHLINPDDPTRPIIGQVFKTFVPTKGYRTHHLTVCWYYRPEQTVHTEDRMFFEREVFKSGHFCDHPVQDVLERVSCQFFVKFIRGRPQAGEFYPGWPSYVCNSRYNDREWLSVRIKNWGSCIPDELRQTDFMSIVPYERHLDPPMVKSPLLRGITGPGFIGEPKSKPTGEDDEDLDDFSKRIRTNKTNQTPPRAYVTLPPTKNGAESREMLPGPSRYQAQPAHTPTQPYRTAQPDDAAQSQLLTDQANRTIAATMGGSQMMDQMATREIIPQETGRLFERDARQQVLWFSGPPIAPGSVHIPAQPTHSVEYLAYLAKRKRGIAEADATVSSRGARYTSPFTSREKRHYKEERSSEVWWAKGLGSEQMAANLKAVIESA